MRLLAEKEKGVPDAQPSKSLVMVGRSRVAHCGFHTRLERQWCRMVSHHNGDNYIGASTRAGQGLAASNPSLARWGLVGVALLTVLLAVVVGVVLLLK